MSNFQLFKKNPTGGETTSTLVEASDSGYGLHFDGAGNIDIASPPDLGTKFSFEFILQADSFASTNLYFVDFGNGGRFIFGTHSSTSYNWAIFDNSSWNSFGVKIVDDLKVHHLVVTVDGTAATLYDNGNQVGTATISASHGIDSCADLVIGSAYSSAVNLFNGTIYRARFWNKTLTAAEVTTSFENATVNFSDQWGSQTDLVSNGTFTGGTTGWGLTSVSYGTNNVDWTASVGWAYIRQSSWDITEGKKYRITYDISGHSANGVLQLWDYGGANTIATLPEITGNGTFTHEFEALKSSSSGVILGKVGNAFVGTMDNVSCVAIGCAVDLDLAFANPTQSRTVQDRAGAADGTASASGCTQVTKIEQLNAEKLSIGGTVPRVGIGLDADNAPSQHLHIDDSTKANVLLTRTAGVADTTTEMGSVFFGNHDTSKYLCAINGVQDGVKASGKLTFATQPDGGSRTTRMTIGSDGNLESSIAPTPTATTVNETADFAGKVVIANGGTSAAGDRLPLIFNVGGNGADNISAAIVGEREASGWNSALSFWVNNVTAGSEGTDAIQEAMRIDSAGLVTAAKGISVTTGGVKFPATQSASADANVLDDYEEGEWSPTVTCSTSGSYTLHTGFDTCVYTKIGRLVQVQGKLYITGESSPSGSIRISLPMTSLSGLSDDSEYVVGSVNFSSHGGTLDNVVANVGAAYAYMWLTSTAEDGTAATITDAHVDTSWWLTFNFSYLA